MALPSVRLLAAAVRTRLDGTTGLTVYETVVKGDPPRDAGGVITSYVVLHPGPGNTDRNTLDDQPGPLLWDFTLLCVGGDHDYLLGAVDTARDRLEGYQLTVAGAKVGLIKPPPGFRPPPARPDHDETPSRLWVPLLFQVLAVPA